jgi:protocatechuate 3,4-dioxygenase beta subunit
MPEQERSPHPPNDFPEYGSSLLRAPKQPLHVLLGRLAELGSPLLAGETIGALDHDLTRQHDAEPLGERITINGRVLDEDGTPLSGTLVEVWQANAAGRYAHLSDQHPAPLDPNFSGAGRCLTDSDGNFRFITIKPGAYPWRNHPNAWRPAHVHFSVFSPLFEQRLITQMYFPGDPLFVQDPVLNSVPEWARERLIARWSLELTEPEWSLGYVWDIVVAGRDATPLDDDASE